MVLNCLMQTAIQNRGTIFFRNRKGVGIIHTNIMQDRLQELFPVHYRNGNILMINADCMEVMKHIKDNQVELSCVDPPYGIGDFSQSDAIQSVRWNNAIPCGRYFIELKRISKKRIIWGANYYNCFEDGNGAIIWYKNIGHPQMSHCEIASISGQKKVDYIHINWSGGIRSIQNDFCHPCQKPVALYKWLLSRYAKPGDRIIDTHGGSGSICIACHDLGYDLTWMELDEDYYKAACERYQNHAAQCNLFDQKTIEKTEQGTLF